MSAQTVDEEELEKGGIHGDQEDVDDEDDQERGDGSGEQQEVADEADDQDDNGSKSRESAKMAPNHKKYMLALLMLPSSPSRVANSSPERKECLDHSTICTSTP